MGIKIIYREPKSTDFNIDDIIIDSKNGHLYYKSSNNELIKVLSDTTLTNVNDIV